MKPSNVIVVGVDGSAESCAALRFAVAEANRRAAWVRVITAFQPPEPWAAAYGMEAPISAAATEANLRAETQRMVDDVLARDPLPPTVDIVTVAGPPVPALLEASREADLLVVGHRGRGGFTGTVLGSVGLQCALHAPCPVTVVRPSRTAGSASSPAPAAAATGR